MFIFDILKKTINNLNKNKESKLVFDLSSTYIIYLLLKLMNYDIEYVKMHILNGTFK